MIKKKEIEELGFTFDQKTKDGYFFYKVVNMENVYLHTFDFVTITIHKLYDGALYNRLFEGKCKSRYKLKYLISKLKI